MIEDCNKDCSDCAKMNKCELNLTAENQYGAPYFTLCDKRKRVVREFIEIKSEG